MKKIYLVLAFLVPLVFPAGNSFGQAVVCPSLSSNSATLTCAEPCATLTATPSVNLTATTSYSVAAVAYAPFAYGAGTAATFGGTAWSTSTDDSYGDIVDLPFNFCFFGNTYSSIVIGTNGNINFNAAALVNAYDPYSISGPMPGSNCAATENAIMGVWNDTYVGGGNIYYKTYGAAPCRQFVVSYDAVDLFLPGTYCDGNTTTSEIVLYESSNIIDIYIGNRQPCTDWNNGYAVCGIENNAGTTFYCPPGENGTTFSATNLGWRFTPTGATSGWTYNWVAPGGASVGTTATVVVCPTTTTVYTVTGTSVACTGVTVSTTATVTPTSTTSPITGTPSMCLGFTTNLFDATAGGTWSSGAPGVATVNASGVVTSVSAGTATISYDAAGCTSIIVVTVNTAPAITGVAPLCIGGTTTLADAVTGGTWISGNPGVATIGLNTGLVTGVTAGTTLITYTTPAGCTTTTTESVVVLSPISGTLSLCVGNTTSLSDPGVGAGGTWTSSLTGVATIGAATGVVTGISSGTSNITYTAAGGCLVTATVTVNPTSPITGILTMCQNFTTTLADALPGGVWMSNTLYVATVNSATGVVTGIGGGTATIVYTLPTGCAVSTVVTVNPKPAPPVPAPPFSYCQFTGSGPVSATGTNLLWYGPGVTGGMATGPTPSTSLAGTITYYVTQTILGCVSDSAADVITIIPQPSAPITHDTTYCQYYNGFILPLNWEVDSASGSALKWYSVTGTLLSGAPIPSTAIPDYPSGTTWHVTQVVNGCESPQASIKVTIIPTPKFDLVYQNWVCQYDSIPLSYNLTGGSVLVSPVYYWQLPYGASAANGTNVSQPSIDVKFDSANVTYEVGYLTIGNLNGECSTQDTFTVRVIPHPSAQSYTKTDICQGDTVSLALSAQSPDAANFTWLIDGVSMTSSPALNIVSANSNTGGPFLISWNTTGIHIISVQTSTIEGCMGLPENDTVNVHALPNAQFGIVPSKTGTLCLEDSVLFQAVLQDANVSYLWQPEHNFNNNNKAEIWGKVEEGRTDITLTVTDPFGCKASYDKQLSPDACCTVLFPNAFTPNGDGHNDQFKPIFNGYHNFHQFRIVNRWGQVVFESANSNPSWDGSFNGVPQDMGVYYYYIKYDCGGNTIEDRGDVTLVR
jgi:gliding motility-associated-like protein